jgi:hypothetical protein
LVRTISRRLERLETRAAAMALKSFLCRIHLIHPENGLTGILVIESDKPTTHILPTDEEREAYRVKREALIASRNRPAY